jgi:phosphatidylglycerol---prolipoprotein diacylglyceryl transferase
MHPIIAHIGSFYIYSYGLMVAVAVATATLLVYKHSPEFGLDKEKIVDFVIAVLIGGIVGARIFYVLLNIRYYLARPSEIINITKGGLVWYGAFFVGILVGIWFVKRNNINFWIGGDLFAPYIALAQGIGRIGCFLNGCCYGSPAPSDHVFAVVFPDDSVFRHPTQIYSAITLIALFMVLRIWQNKRRFNGEIFLGYGMLYSLARFGLEFIRGDNPRILAHLTISQLISIAIFAVCLIVFIYRFRVWKKNP